jgi:fatty acid desaturase
MFPAPRKRSSPGRLRLYITAMRLEGTDWYRSPLDKETLKQLTRRSDAKGLLQCGGFMALTALTAGASVYAWLHLPLVLFLLILFIHGTVFVFYSNGFHELTHGTMFRAKWLNAVFLRIFSFLGWNSHVRYKASHMRHHLYTLHPPDDLEVVLPIRLMARSFVLSAVVDPITLWVAVGGAVRLALGRLEGPWEHALFPESDPVQRRRLFNWSRTTLLGHAAIIGVSAATGWWLLAVLTTGARFYGGWLSFLLNYTQHIGLQDNVADFRLCTRTVILNPVYRFLYFHMNYHAEHHMYASVPCYNLGRLRRAILTDMPPARGLVGAWREIISVLHRQKTDPGYQLVYQLPAPAVR